MIRFEQQLLDVVDTPLILTSFPLVPEVLSCLLPSPLPDCGNGAIRKQIKRKANQQNSRKTKMVCIDFSVAVTFRSKPHLII